GQDAARNTAIARRVLLLASRNDKVIFPSWPGARRRIWPLQSEVPRCLETLFLGTRSQRCGPTTVSFRASFFPGSPFYRLRLRAGSTVTYLTPLDASSHAGTHIWDTSAVSTQR